MGRQTGSRNEDYEEERLKLVNKLRSALLDDPTLSFRAMARAASVTPPTLKHYFGNREGVLQAVFVQIRRDGDAYVSELAVPKLGSPMESLRELITSLVIGWRIGSRQMHELGLRVGIGDSRIGPAYVEQVLEPALQAVETRLSRHMAAGDLSQGDVRLAALQLVSPLLLAFIHQDALQGSRCRPLDVDALLEDHVSRFVRAYTL